MTTITFMPSATRSQILRPTATSIASQLPEPGGDGDTIKNWSSLIGIITAIVGNVLIALALNVQRYAHTRLQKARSHSRQRARAALKRMQSGQDGANAVSRRGPYGALGTGEYIGSTQTTAYESMADSGESEPLTASYHSSGSTAHGEGSSDDGEEAHEPASSYLKSPYWWLGQILITLGEMGNFLAYGFAPASIVSPLGVVALISNCIIAPLMFHEKFRARDFWGVVIAVGGVVTVVLSAKQEETQLDPHAVLDAITTLAFEIYLGVTIGLILLLMWASPRYGRRTILIDLGLVGLFGGYTALATKGVSSMLSSTLWGAFATPVTYILILILLGTAIMQIRYVNKALQRFDSTQVIPIQFVMFTLCVILGSAILYRDFERTDAEQAGKFVGGCLLTFFGVFLITSGRETLEDDDEDHLSETESIEETIGLAQQESLPGDGQNSRSRRSSKVSHISFAATTKAKTTHTGIDALGVSPPSVPHESAPLLTQTRSEPRHPPPPPRGLRTLSADSVMLLSPATPPAGSASQPATPIRDNSAQQHNPFDSALAVRPGYSASKTWHSKRSGTFISPSPFSSTVTAVVKDAFLRPIDSRLPRKSSMHRLRSSIRAGLFFSDDQHEGAGSDARSSRQAAQSASETDITGTAVDPGTEIVDTVDTRSRSRSVSDALGDFFRSKRVRKSEDARDGEDGPSEPL